MVTVPAPLDALPAFVKAGTVLPTLDPSVASLYVHTPPSTPAAAAAADADAGATTPPTPTAAAAAAADADAGATTYADRAHILHLWAWADAEGRCVFFLFCLVCWLALPSYFITFHITHTHTFTTSHSLLSALPPQLPPPKRCSADSGPLSDGSRIRITPLDLEPRALLCSFSPPIRPAYPYYPASGSTKPRTYILQLALPAAWPHGRVGGAARVLGGTGGEDQPKETASYDGRAERRRAVVRAMGGWRELVAAVGVDGEVGGKPVGDGWAWDGEEQGTLWLRVSAAADEEGGDGGVVRVVLAFDEDDDEGGSE